MKKMLAKGRMLSVLLISIFWGCEFSGDQGINHAPVIISVPNTLAYTSELYIYVVKAHDEDNYLFLTYTLITYPEGMTINSATGEIRWLPTLRQVGNHRIEVRVTDGSAGTSQFFAIRVSPLDNGVPFQRGFTLVAWEADAYLKPQSDESLRQMKADGVEYVSIVVYWFQDTINSTTIYPYAPITPSDVALVHAITYAHSLGLKVVLKPDVLVMTGAWRGDITFSDEADWAAWFASYNSYQGYYLDLAEANRVEVVIIGTELKRTEGREADWRDTIALARTRFSGLLTYDANHDSFFGVAWWDAVDFIGISAYFKLTDKNDPTVEEIKAAWEPTKKIIRALAAYYDQDVVFTEIGYASREGTNRCPWCTPSELEDRQEQADCYQAAFETFYNEPWFKGMYWWAWTFDLGAIEHPYDVYNKPAEPILRQWYAGY